jgi:hypothetical protein
MGTDFEFPPISDRLKRKEVVRRKFVVCILFSSPITLIRFFHSNLFNV